MTGPLVHDITIYRRSRWSMSVVYVNPLPNGLPNMASPVAISGWSFEWELTDVNDPGKPVSVYVATSPSAITVDSGGQITVALEPAVTTGLPLIVGTHSLLAIPDVPDYDQLLVAGRALVTDGG